MKIIARSLVFAAAVAAAFSLTAARASVQVGKPAPDFTLTDITGKTHRLSDYKGKIVVLEWVNPECPIDAGHYAAGNIQSTQKVAREMGAVWLSINSASYPGAQGNYSEAQAAAWQKQQGAVTTAYFRDQTGKVGRLYDARTTPHMFVINADGNIAYQGAIDSGNGRDIPRAKNYVKAALTALKEGKPIEKTATTPYGCSIKYGDS
jgi:alkyl hydroperoxide reductase subunit AhpC